MRKLVTKLFLAGILATSIWSFSALAQSAVELSLNPKQTVDEKPTTLNYELKPTKSLEDVLTVSNHSETSTYQFKVYAADAIQGGDGATAFKLPGLPENHIGSWLTFNQSNQSIKPGQTLSIPYKINIPAKVTPGTYKGGLIVEVINSTEIDAPTQVKVVTRLIEPVIVSVPGRKTIDYSLDSFNYEQHNGTPGFYLKFSNKGNVILRGEVNLTIVGTLLSEPYQMTLNHPTILQDSSFEKAFSFENPPMFGSYDANLDFRVYQYDVNKDQFVLLTTIHKSIQFGIIPYGCIIALVILIILIILAERWRRKYMKDLSENTFIHKVKKGETVTSIATIYKLNWRKIIKMNHLHRPYTLIAGDELVLPLPEAETPPKPKQS